MKLSFMNLSIFFLISIFSMSGFNTISADENPKSVCQTVDETSLSKVSLESYNELFYNVKKRKDRAGAIYSKEEWYDGLYFTLHQWTSSLELCAGGNETECQKILEHIIFLSNQKNSLINWSGKEDWDYIWESTFWNNTSSGVILYSYKVSSERIEVPADVHNQIGKWMKKVIQSNKNLYLAGVNGSFNNHMLQWLRVNALYGLLWNDKKALKVSKKGLKTFMKKNKTKAGALKHEAVRGSRGLFYHGRAYLAIFSIADTLEQAGILVYDNVFSDAINKSVNFYIDASADNKLIYKWAKKKKNNDGNPKVQEQANTGNSWVGMFINNLGDAYPDTVTKLYKSETIQKNFFESLDDEDAGFWEVSDSECFYPVYRQGKFQ